MVAAADRRVAAVVAQVPFAGIAEDYTDDQLAGWAALRDALLSGERGAPAEPYGPVPVVTETEGGAAFLGQPESWRWFAEWGDRPGSHLAQRGARSATTGDRCSSTPGSRSRTSRPPRC